jgi:hypothetical protein
MTGDPDQALIRSTTHRGLQSALLIDWSNLCQLKFGINIQPPTFFGGLGGDS